MRSSDDSFVGWRPDSTVPLRPRRVPASSRPLQTGNPVAVEFSGSDRPILAFFVCLLWVHELRFTASYLPRTKQTVTLQSDVIVSVPL